MCDVLARLHQFDIKKLGLENYGKTSHDYLARQIKTWTQQYKDSQTETIPAIDLLIENLGAKVPQTQSRVTIVHGDFRLDNMIFHPTENRVIAVLDWELSTIGDPYSDLAYNLLPHYTPRISFLGIGKVDFSFYGIPHDVTYLDRYYAQTGFTRLSFTDLSFYLSFSYFRLAGICQGVYRRSQLGNASSQNAKEYLKLVHGLSQLSLHFFQRSQLGDVREVPDLYASYSEKFKETYRKLLVFMDQWVYPNERQFLEAVEKSQDR